MNIIDSKIYKKNFILEKKIITIILIPFIDQFEFD